jgi:hypothetical protein
MSAFVLWVLAGSAVAASPRREYVRDHREWTRDLVLYRNFSTALTMQATLLEPEFRVSLAAERARLLAPSAEDQASFVARMVEDGAQYHDVVFAADSSFDNAQEFGPSDRRWNVRLLVDGVEATLVSVELVRRPSPLHDALYVQHDIWSNLWIARFERAAADPRRVELIVGSGYGNGSLLWELTGR